MNPIPLHQDPAYQDLLSDQSKAEADPDALRYGALAAHITGLAEQWRSDRRALYDEKFALYNLYAQAMFDDRMKEKASERSKLVSPLTLSAIRSVVDELSETVMPNGEIGQLTGSDSLEFGKAREEFRLRLAKDGWEDSIVEAIIIAATFGDCLGVMETEEVTEYSVAEQEVAPGQVVIGSMRTERVVNKIRAWAPSNWLANYNVTRIEDSELVILEETLPLSVVTKRMAEGQYRIVPLGEDYIEYGNELEADRTMSREGVNMQYCIGLVPAEYMGEKAEGGSGYVEALVTLGNGQVLSASVNPTIRRQRGIAHLKFEKVPGRLLGRGIPEAGLMMQRAYDGAIRAHMDSLSITSVPVTVGDASRLPRGLNLQLYAGRHIPVQGDVNGAFSRLDLGQTDPALLATASTFERLHMTATGTMDSGLLPDLMRGTSNPDAMVMALSGLVKRHRQRATNLQRKFLIPLLTEAWYRCVQFEPDTFPINPPSFEVVTTSGILERHLETMRRTSVAATLGPNSPLVMILTRDIIEMSGSRNREKALQMIDQMIQQSMNDKSKGQEVQNKMIEVMTLIEKTKSETALNYEQAAKVQVERQLLPRKAQADLIGALSKNANRDGSGPDEFKERVQIMELMLKEDELGMKRDESERNYEITKLQALASGNLDPSSMETLLGESATRSAEVQELLAKLDEYNNTDEEHDYDEEGKLVRTRRVPKNRKEQ